MHLFTRRWYLIELGVLVRPTPIALGHHSNLKENAIILGMTRADRQGRVSQKSGLDHSSNFLNVLIRLSRLEFIRDIRQSNSLIWSMAICTESRNPIKITPSSISRGLLIGPHNRILRFTS
jgi:hypothetical protein